MPEVARLGDPITCGDVIAEGSGDVFAEGMPVTRAESAPKAWDADLTAGHCFTPTQIKQGSSTVFVNNLPVARVGDPIEAEPGYHFCVVPPNWHPGAVLTGAGTVFADS